MQNNTNNKKGSVIVYSIEKTSVRDALVEKLRAMFINILPKSPTIIDVKPNVHKDKIDITVSADISLDELKSLNDLISSSETILSDNLKRQLETMRLKS